MERNNLCNFESGHHGKHSCEVMKFGSVVQEEYHLKKSLWMDERMHDGRTTDKD